MENLENLVKQHKETRKNAKLLKQQCIKAKDAIPYCKKEYNEAKGIELRNKYIKLDDEWKTVVEKVMDLEQKLNELGYEFPNDENENIVNLR